MARSDGPPVAPSPIGGVVPSTAGGMSRARASEAAARATPDQPFLTGSFRAARRFRAAEPFSDLRSGMTERLRNSVGVAPRGGVAGSECGSQPAPPPDVDGTARAVRPPNGLMVLRRLSQRAGRARRPSTAGSGAELAPAPLMATDGGDMTTGRPTPWREGVTVRTEDLFTGWPSRQRLGRHRRGPGLRGSRRRRVPGKAGPAAGGSSGGDGHLRRPAGRADQMEMVGQTKGSQDVEIRARVEGFLDEVAFTEGSLVRKGQVLYRIDPKTFEAALANAKADLATAAGASRKDDERREAISAAGRPAGREPAGTGQRAFPRRAPRRPRSRRRRRRSRTRNSISATRRSSVRSTASSARRR